MSNGTAMPLCRGTPRCSQTDRQREFTGPYSRFPQQLCPACLTEWLSSHGVERQRKNCEAFKHTRFLNNLSFMTEPGAYYIIFACSLALACSFSATVIFLNYLLEI